MYAMQRVKIAKRQLYILVPLVCLMFGIVVWYGTVLSNQMQTSVEVGVSTASPLGPSAGRAVPASGCSDLHDSDCAAPTITVDKKFVRHDSVVRVCWNPDNHKVCQLSTNLTGNPNVVACENVTLNHTSTFSITCTDGVRGESSVVANVIPYIYEQ